MIRAVCFDIDGTLADTLLVVYSAFQDVTQRFLGRTYSEEEIARLFGPSEEGIIRQLMPSNQWDDDIKTYHSAYERAHASCRTPYEGIDAALGLLKKKGVLLAVVTGKGAFSANLSLEKLELMHYFDLIEYGSVSGDNKASALRRILENWALKPSELAYGDSPGDMRDAKNVGVIALGAGWGNNVNLDQLKQDATKVFPTVSSFINWINDHL
jgi:phosphoglycolate phosphatase-like HAD superfamily hydrolase